eukprot:TRINITY_DN2503_c0_g1_i2.p1 TRINITY_DN2503_c0_g1~~TRINITY_DN2503_c0_g1_i2.p1  ORF type:complete len:104 (-),score=15.35 TRINITY_DN2503_c0_g1_i2:31-306(-)
METAACYYEERYFIQSQAGQSLFLEVDPNTKDLMLSPWRDHENQLFAIEGELIRSVATNFYLDVLGGISNGHKVAISPKPVSYTHLTLPTT